MQTSISHDDLRYLLDRVGAGTASVETERGFVSGSALTKDGRFHVTAYTLEDPTVNEGKRYRRVMEQWAASPEEAAKVLREAVLRHAKIREVLHEAQRRIYTARSVQG